VVTEEGKQEAKEGKEEEEEEEVRGEGSRVRSMILAAM
jgi:hypothetical protein